MLENPFHTYSLAAPSYDRIRELCVDRETELNFCKKALVQRKHNVLLYGDRGIGKTFLIRLLEKEIMETEETIFPCLINAANLQSYGNPDEIASFSRALLLQFCAALWTKLLGKSYLDLRDRLEESGKELTLRRKDEKTIQRIYSHLMLQNREAEFNYLNSFGFSAGVKGEMKGEASIHRHQSDVLPFEFAEFAGELVGNVLKAHKKQRAIILCDEANHMSLFKQEEILERYLDLFSSKKFQFVFVAGLFPWEKKSYLPSCFEATLALSGFASRKHIQELIAGYQPVLKFSDETINMLFEALLGHPLYTIQACARAYDIAQEAGIKDITPSLMMRVIREIDSIRKNNEQIVRRARNARK